MLTTETTNVPTVPDSNQLENKNEQRIYKIWSSCKKLEAVLSPAPTFNISALILYPNIFTFWDKEYRQHRLLTNKELPQDRFVYAYPKGILRRILSYEKVKYDLKENSLINKYKKEIIFFMASSSVCSRAELEFAQNRACIFWLNNEEDTLHKLDANQLLLFGELISETSQGMIDMYPISETMQGYASDEMKDVNIRTLTDMSESENMDIMSPTRGSTSKIRKCVDKNRCIVSSEKTSCKTDEKKNCIRKKQPIISTENRKNIENHMCNTKGDCFRNCTRDKCRTEFTKYTEKKYPNYQRYWTHPKIEEEIIKLSHVDDENCAVYHEINEFRSPQTRKKETCDKEADNDHFEQGKREKEPNMECLQRLPFMLDSPNSKIQDGSNYMTTHANPCILLCHPYEVKMELPEKTIKAQEGGGKNDKSSVDRKSYADNSIQLYAKKNQHFEGQSNPTLREYDISEQEKNGNAKVFEKIHFEDICNFEPQKDAIISNKNVLTPIADKHMDVWNTAFNNALDPKKNKLKPMVSYERENTMVPSPLHSAILSNSSSSLVSLLRDGADPLDPPASSPLSLAVDLGYNDMVDCLLEYVDIDTIVFGDISPQHIAAGCGRYKILRSLLSSGLDPNQPAGLEISQETFEPYELYEGDTCLHIAARNGYSALVTLLLDYGANLHIINSKNQNAREVAAERRRTLEGEGSSESTVLVGMLREVEGTLEHAAAISVAKLSETIHQRLTVDTSGSSKFGINIAPNITSDSSSSSSRPRRRMRRKVNKLHKRKKWSKSATTIVHPPFSPFPTLQYRPNAERKKDFKTTREWCPEIRRQNNIFSEDMTKKDESCKEHRGIFIESQNDLPHQHNYLSLPVLPNSPSPRQAGLSYDKTTLFQSFQRNILSSDQCNGHCDISDPVQYRVADHWSENEVHFSENGDHFSENEDTYRTLPFCSMNIMESILQKFGSFVFGDENISLSSSEESTSDFFTSDEDDFNLGKKGRRSKKLRHRYDTDTDLSMTSSSSMKKWKVQTTNTFRTKINYSSSNEDLVASNIKVRNDALDSLNKIRNQGVNYLENIKTIGSYFTGLCGVRDKMASTLSVEPHYMINKFLSIILRKIGNCGCNSNSNLIVDHNLEKDNVDKKMKKENDTKQDERRKPNEFPV